MNQMIVNPEKRNAFRLKARKYISIIDIKTGSVFIVKLLNICSNGFYLESDRFLKVGSEYHICEKNFPSDFQPMICRCSRVKILWRKELKSSALNYGYGVEMIFENNEQQLRINSSIARKDYRKYSRRPYSKKIFFTAHNGISKGISKNISQAGISLETAEVIKKGDVIYITLPLINDTDIKVKGKIVWVNKGCFGVRFQSVKKMDHLQVSWS